MLNADTVKSLSNRSAKAGEKTPGPEANLLKYLSHTKGKGAGRRDERKGERLGERE